MKRLILIAALSAICAASGAQTSSSLFLKKDKVQVTEIKTAEGVDYKSVGHHGPAVENLQMALRIYFNASGAIDVYNKSHDALELEPYRWYPNAKQQAAGAGVDEYYVGKTVGLGGLAIFDGEKYAAPVAGDGMTARVGGTRHGSFAEVVYDGVPVGREKVSLTLRIDMADGSRWARVTLSSDKPVLLATGVNFPDGAEVECGGGLISVWGTHPADVSASPRPIGAAMSYPESKFCAPEKVGSQMLIRTKKPLRKVSTRVVSASSVQVGGAGSRPDAAAWKAYLSGISRL